MNIAERIRNNFNKGFFGKAMAIPELPAEYPAWTLKESGWVGVAVPLKNYYDFMESFAEVNIITEKNVLINNRSYDLLMIVCNSMQLRNEFAIICENFVDPGENGNARRMLIESPVQWWENWKELIGNKAQTREAYDVLGELLTIEKLLASGKTAIWAGTDHATHDIESDSFSVEVKSTIARYGYEVTINSIYQMSSVKNRGLYLSYVRFERSDLGQSINEMVRKLVAHGISSDILENNLIKCGLEKGRTARERKYRTIEWKKYTVDDRFPMITEASFKEGMLPRNVVRFNYTIDLSGIEGENLL